MCPAAAIERPVAALEDPLRSGHPAEEIRHPRGSAAAGTCQQDRLRGSGARPEAVLEALAQEAHFQQASLDGGTKPERLDRPFGYPLQIHSRNR